MSQRITAPAALALLAAVLLGGTSPAFAAAEEESPRDVVYRPTPPAPRAQTPTEAAAKSDGCMTCHTAVDQPTPRCGRRPGSPRTTRTTGRS